ncbi:MAG: dual CXXC motif small (seleno)protein [Thermodesulfobacteriota bacterium]
MRCRDCGAGFSLEELADAIDADLEEMLGDLPCDRL